MATRLEAKQFLQNLNVGEDHIKDMLTALQQQVRELHEVEDIIINHPSPENDQLLAVLRANIASLEAMLINTAGSTRANYQKFLDLMDQVPDPLAREVLIRHYCNGQCLNMIAQIKHFSDSKVKYLHRRGLDYIARLL